MWFRRLQVRKNYSAHNGKEIPTIEPGETIMKKILAIVAIVAATLGIVGVAYAKLND